jgi:thiol-disulfide isomerase/thioredoxin
MVERMSLPRLSWVRAAIAAAALFVLPAIAPGDHLMSFAGGKAWLNSAPLTPASLQGKVVLVDFWDYTCINCLRTLPYLREWYKRYASDGFVIVGVEAPEFRFETDGKNLADATSRLGVVWPVVSDFDFAVWKRYGINAWPTELLFDQSGKLVEEEIGEGNYPQTEAEIQALLRKANPSLNLPPPMALLPQDNYDKPGAVCYPKTAEIVVERSRIGNAVSGDPRMDQNYQDPGQHKDGTLYLDGYWRATRQSISYSGGGGYVALPYHAIQVETVMRSNGGPIRVNVTQDDKPVPRDDAGSDLHYDAKGNSYVLVDAPRAYEVIMNAAFGHHELVLSPQGGGLRIYDFAFESCEVPGAK